jgi:hypothetical protein
VLLGLMDLCLDLVAVEFAAPAGVDSFYSKTLHEIVVFHWDSFSL